MKWDSVTRRFFLQQSGTVLMLPFLPSLLSKTAYAQAQPQKSFVGIAAFNGLYRMYGPTSVLMPPTNPTGGSLAGYSSMTPTGRHKIHSRPLSEISAQNGKISDIIDASFNPYLSKMLMLQGFDFPSLAWRHHHGNFGNMADSMSGPNGMPGMASIDQVMAHSSNFYKNASLISRSVAYNANPNERGNYGASHAWDNPSDKVNSSVSYKQPISNPATLWDTYFKSSSSQSINLKGTIIDRVLADYNALKTSSKLGAEDRQKLDQHVTMLHETQRRVAAVGGVCNLLRPSSSLSDRKLILRTMNDVIVALIACGMCHSFLGWANSIVSSNPEDWHTWSHAGYDSAADGISDAVIYQNLVAQNRSVMHDMFLDLVAKLDQAGQLNNSLVAVIQEHSKRGHESWNVPVILAGSAGGVLKTGQYIDYRNLSVRDDLEFTRFGYPINQLLANILRAVGVPPAEYEALNKSGFTNPIFVDRSGYGHSKFDEGASAGNSFGGHYRGSWSGHNLSDWLPLILA